MRDRANGNPAGSRYGQAALAGEATRVAAAVRGSRSDILNAAAFRLGRLAAADHLGWNQIVCALEQAAQQNGHVSDDGHAAIRATITSGLNAGLRHPAPRQPQGGADCADAHDRDREARPGLTM